MDVYVERLYAALTDALRHGRPRAFDAPVTVAEIYQDLVPYRVVRVPLGFELNADYEHALLQLLAGVGELARIEPQEAAAELRDELRSPNPNVGLFRKFAACDVWVTRPPDADAEPEDEVFAPEPVEEEEETQAGAPAVPDPGRAHEASPPPEPPAAARATEPAAAGGAERPGAQPAASAARPEAVASRTEAATSHAAASTVEPAPSSEEADATSKASGGGAAAPLRDTARRCGFCDAKLPAGRLVRFCPHCGSDQTRRPCAACGESLEAAWRFCVSCGAPQEGRPSA